MAIWRPAEYQHRGFLGVALVTLGSAALALDVPFFTDSLTSLFAKFPTGLFSLIPTLGLSFLNAARALAFDQIDYFSLIPRILLLFCAMVAVIVGLVLLRSPYSHGAHSDTLQEYLYNERETDHG